MPMSTIYHAVNKSTSYSHAHEFRYTLPPWKANGNTLSFTINNKSLHTAVRKCFLSEAESTAKFRAHTLFMSSQVSSWILRSVNNLFYFN